MNYFENKQNFRCFFYSIKINYNIFFNRKRNKCKKHYNVYVFLLKQKEKTLRFQFYYILNICIANHTVITSQSSNITNDNGK